MFSKPQQIVIDVYSAEDRVKIPVGYFYCISTRGIRTLGHNSLLGLSWSVSRPAEMTNKELDQLPLVRLHANTPYGVLRVGDGFCVDTDVLDESGGIFECGY